MEHVAGANPNDPWLKERGNDYGDWLAIGSKTSKDLIATVYWAYDASIMMRMAEVLDRPSPATSDPPQSRWQIIWHSPPGWC